MEQRNEPTTAEIVKETRLCSQPDWNCDKCSRNGMPFGDCFTELYLQAADRLEQLERENAELTARAEKAGAERDAATNDLEHVMLDSGELCDYCSRDWAACYKCEPEWRGLRGKGNDGK